MRLFLSCVLVISAFLLFRAAAVTINVKTVAELNEALGKVLPGDVIELANGSYAYYKTFYPSRSGTAKAPITIRGSRGAILSGKPYGFRLHANYWRLIGFSVTNSLKGIVFDSSSNNIIDDVEVYNIQQEGIHFRWSSRDNIVQNSYIHDTGTRDKGFGEGIYVGSAVNNWINGPDRSDNTQILNNRIGPNVASECVDIKEGSCCGILRGNTFVGPQSGQNYADSWIDLKGSKYTIENNTGTNPLLDGIQIHRISDGGADSGCNNIIRYNQCKGLPRTGQCVANTVHVCNNTINNNIAS